MKSQKIIAKILLVATLTNVLGASFANAEGTSINKRYETVYINADAYGKTTEINVYNKYELANVSSFKEYGQFNSIQVLTGNFKPSTSGDEINWNITDNNQLGYIGNLDNSYESKMPWNIEIKYYLNGVETLADELYGKQGLVKVVMKLTPNENAPEYYQNNYMMQVSSSFDMSDFLSAESEDAIVSTVGNTKTLTFMILPGQDKEISMEIGSNSFKMDSITFAMIPLEGDILELIQDIVDDKKELRNAIKDTNGEVDTVLDGLADSSKDLSNISNNTEKLQNGLTKLNESKSDRVKYIDEIYDELQKLSGDIESFEENRISAQESISYAKERALELQTLINSITTKLKSLEDDVDDLVSDLERMQKESKEVDTYFKDLKDMLLDTKDALGSLNELLGNVDAAGDIDMAAIEKGLKNIQTQTTTIATEAGARLQSESPADPSFYSKTISTAKSIGNSLQDVATELEKAEDLLGSTSSNTSKVSKSLIALQDSIIEVAIDTKSLSTYSEELPNDIGTLKSTFEDINSTLNIVIKDLDTNTSGDTENVIKLLDNASNTLEKLKNVKDTSKSIISTASNTLLLLKKDLNVVEEDIYSGANSTIESTQALLNTLGKVASESSAIKDSKNVIYNLIEEDLDDLENKTNVFDMDPDSTKPSFVSDKNTEPEKVQIFVQSAAIKETKLKDVTDLEPTEEKKSFWDKLGEIWQAIISFIKKLFGRS